MRVLCQAASGEPSEEERGEKGLTLVAGSTKLLRERALASKYGVSKACLYLFTDRQVCEDACNVTRIGKGNLLCNVR